MEAQTGLWVSVCEPWTHAENLIVDWDLVEKHAGVPNNADGHVGNVKLVESDLEDP